MRYNIGKETESLGRAIAEAWQAGDLEQIFHVTITPNHRLIPGEGMKQDAAVPFTVLGLRELNHVGLIQATERRGPRGDGDHVFEVTIWRDLAAAAENNFERLDLITHR